MYNVLVCDDEKDIVAALKIYLTAEGYQVYEAFNGKEALEVLSREEIHLVLMDIMMPVMDGITAMVKLRENSNVPVIMLTAKSEDTDKVLGLNIGAALTPTEYNILKLLMENIGKVYSPSQIYSVVWNDSPFGTENTVAVHIRHLREKLEYNPAEPRYLKSVWGRGYKLEQ